MQGPFTLLTFDTGLDDVLYMENSRGQGDLMVAGQGGEIITGSDGDNAEREADAAAVYSDEFKALAELALDPKESMNMILNAARDMSKL